jgi:PhnB protein
MEERTMSLNPYLFFDGQCEAAFQFYARSLGGKIEAMIPHAGTPAEAQVPAEWKTKIMHARLVVNGQALMGSDTPPGRYTKPQGFYVAFQVKEAGEAERLFAALAENGRVTMAIQETFWATRFGMLVDQFGIPWMINCEKSA